MSIYGITVLFKCLYIVVEILKMDFINIVINISIINLVLLSTKDNYSRSQVPGSAFPVEVLDLVARNILCAQIVRHQLYVIINLEP